MGRFWYFMLMDSTRTYSISKPYITTEKDQLLQIIAILRHFKIILERDLLD
jgi:translation elongation factor P/translation initiation factor 5A